MSVGVDSEREGMESDGVLDAAGCLQVGGGVCGDGATGAEEVHASTLRLPVIHIERVFKMM